MKAWHEAAKARMAELGLTQADLVEPLGVKTRGAVGHYLAGRRKIKADQGEALASFLGMTYDELFGGKKSDELALSGAGFTPLFYLDDKNQRERPVPFADQFLMDRDINPRTAAIYQAENNAMSPTIQQGDLVAIHTGPGAIASGGIFLFTVGRELRLARLQRLLNGRWRVTSDNPDKKLHCDEEIAEEELGQLNIIGMAKGILYRGLYS